jgi:hypothetical protein
MGRVINSTTVTVDAVTDVGEWFVSGATTTARRGSCWPSRRRCSPDGRRSKARGVLDAAGGRLG